MTQNPKEKEPISEDRLTKKEKMLVKEFQYELNNTPSFYFKQLKEYRRERAKNKK